MRIQRFLCSNNYSENELNLPKRLIRYRPQSPIITYTILEIQLRLPKRKATRSNLNIPTRSQFSAPTITSARAVLSNHFMKFPPSLSYNSAIISTKTGNMHLKMI